MINYRSTRKSEGGLGHEVFLLGGKSHARDHVWEKNRVCVKIIHAQLGEQEQLASKGARCCDPGVNVGFILSQILHIQSEI